MGDHRGEMGEQGGQMTMSVGPQTKNKLAESSEGLNELLPGIPDSITLTHIAPKLPWRAVRILSLVSGAWKRAVHSREVYQARIRAGSTETFVVLCHTLTEFMPRVEDYYSVDAHAVSIYSVEDKQCYQLPAIPGLERGIPWSCQCISLDGKVYILAGEPELYGDYNNCKVYVLDVAGKWQWKPCADMLDVGRLRFACGVKDEQIYAFGGCVRESEVYDPRADTWSSIVPAIKLRSRHQATTLGEDLVVHGGNFYSPAAYIRATDDTEILHRSFDLEVYHPGRNEWRVVVLHGTADADNLERTYFGHGKLHVMTSKRIYVLDLGTDEYTLTHLHSSLYEEFGPLVTDQTLHYVDPCVARVVNGELLALVDCYTHEAVESIQTFLLQSKGFGSENRELVWEKVACSLSFGHPATPVIWPIQL